MSKKASIKLKTDEEIRAEMDAMPTEDRGSRRSDNFATVHGTLNRLQVGMVVMLRGEPHRVDMTNECRARCSPVRKERKVVKIVNKLDDEKSREFEAEVSGSSVNVSPNSDCEILSFPSST